MRRVKLFVLTAAFLGLATSAAAAPITPNDPLWYEFLFAGPGSFATGCSGGCVPSSAGNSQDAPAPPWTFALGAGGGILTVTDAFLRTDRFEIFDFGVSIGLTSVPGGTGDCGSNPVVCLADPLASHGSFVLAGGPHSITIQQVSGIGGAGFFQVVPEPAVLLLLGSGLAGMAARRRVSRR